DHTSPYLSWGSDFEHEDTCPVGQRIQAKQQLGGRPRAVTLPAMQTQMPTLQS
ncbi:hypothetical protein BGZ65_007619, partial [Modicella reniformis]